MHIVHTALLVAAGLGLGVGAHAGETKPRKAEKLICKAKTETDSPAKRKKECVTRGERDKAGEATRLDWARTIDEIRTRPTGE